MSYGSNYTGVGARANTTRVLTDPDVFFSTDPRPLDQSDSPLVAVVDDSYFARRVVVLGLARARIDVADYGDGFEALDAWQSGRDAPPRVLLLDIGMPRLSGYEVARLIRGKGEFADTRIIMLSSYSGPLDRVRSRLVGACDFLAKPFTAPELVRRVRRALGLFDPGEDWPE